MSLASLFSDARAQDEVRIELDMDVDNVMTKTKKAIKPSASTVRQNSLLSFNDISPLFHDHHPQQHMRARGLGRGSLDRSFPPASPNIRLRPMKCSDYKPKLDQLVGSSTLEEYFPNQQKAMALAISKLSLKFCCCSYTLPSLYVLAPWCVVPLGTSDAAEKK